MKIREGERFLFKAIIGGKFMWMVGEKGKHLGASFEYKVLLASSNFPRQGKPLYYGNTLSKLYDFSRPVRDIGKPDFIKEIFYLEE